MQLRKTSDWFQEQRQAWIAEMLAIYGFITRAHLQRKFGITAVAVSGDFKRFMLENPGIMDYSAKDKAYIACKKPESYCKPFVHNTSGRPRGQPVHNHRAS